MKLTLALLARYAEVDPDSGLLNLTGGGVDVFGMKRLPAEFTMACALRFLYREVESGQTFQVALATLDPQLQIVGKPTDFQITPHLGAFHVEGGLGTFTITGAVTLAVKSVGLHNISITIDGAIAGDIPFQVLLSDDK